MGSKAWRAASGCHESSSVGLWSRQSQYEMAHQYFLCPYCRKQCSIWPLILPSGGRLIDATVAQPRMGPSSALVVVWQRTTSEAEALHTDHGTQYKRQRKLLCNCGHRNFLWIIETRTGAPVPLFNACGSAGRHLCLTGIENSSRICPRKGGNTKLPGSMN